MLNSSRSTFLWLMVYLGFIPLLTIVPYWFPVDPSVPSAASVAGYNNQIAYVLAVTWSLSATMLVAVLERLRCRDYHGEVLQDVCPRSVAITSRRYNVYAFETAIVVAVVAALYFPVFLARYGPYTEDSVFLNALHRMNSGQRPYADFEFLYGPLMIYPAYYWTQLFGYSMTTYYAYLAFLEVLTFGSLLIILQRYFPCRLARLGSFILIGVFLFNTLLGPNQNGIRKLLPIVIMLTIAGNPRSRRTVVVGSLLLGLQLSYSHDYGIAAVSAVLAMYAWLGIREQDRKYWFFAMLGITVALLSWYSVSVLLTGSTFWSYIAETAYLAKRFDAGQSTFRFYWTVNSLALFGVLSFACLIVGRGLAKQRGRVVGSGDLLVFGGLIYALVALKSGLNRSDLWHLNPPLLPLMFAFLLPSVKNVFTYSDRARDVVTSFLVIAAITYLIGLAPTASYYANGWFNGLRDTTTLKYPVPPVRSFNSRGPSIELEKSHPTTEVVQLASYLAAAPQSKRPVLFYGDAWNLGPRIGVYKTDFINDDFLHSEERGMGVGEFLHHRQSALVVMNSPVYKRLFGLADPELYPEFREQYEPTVTKLIGSWLSTNHYEGVEAELHLKEERWKRTVGNYIRHHYELVMQFGDLVVLTRKKA